MNEKKDWNYINKKNKSKFFHSKNRFRSLIRHYLFNRIVYAFISALLLGVMFGLFLLQFVEQNSIQHVKHQPAAADEVKEGLHKNEGTSISKLETATVHVIQTGVFQSEENAKDWVNKHGRKELPFFIWERKEQYYVLTGPFSTDRLAQTSLEMLNELGIEAFVKEWQVEKEVSHLSATDVAKLNTFITLWQQSLTAVEQQQHSLADEWTKWLESSNQESTTIIAFQEKVQNILYGGASEKSLSKQQLLNLLFEFEQSVFSS